MAKRFVSIWFRHLTTDRLVRRQPELRDTPFVLAAPERGRMVIKAVSAPAQARGINAGMAVADCRAIFPGLQVFDDDPELTEKLLRALAEWCLRYTPIAAVDPPDGLLLDVSGCPHLWGGERGYLKDIIEKLTGYGYHVRVAIADSIGTAWAVARFGKTTPIIEPGRQADALLSLPPAALRLEANALERMAKLGLYQISNIIHMPRSAIRRRFGQLTVERLKQALGEGIETIEPVQPIQPYQERLPSLEPIRTAVGIEIAIKRLLENLCKRLQQEEKGLRKALLKLFRVDGKQQQIAIGTNRASSNAEHLFKLFELRISSIEPALGIELFLLEASVVEDLPAIQETIWKTTGRSDHSAIAELLDKLAGKLGMQTIHRYLPDEHYWPERSVKLAVSLDEEPLAAWRTDLPRPVHLLRQPEAIDVMVQIPDYPPAHFRYKGELHIVKKADGPERIEQEWWIQQGQHRDYYCLEDENGARYWIFRLGHYDSGEPKWFIHGFFA